MLRKLIERKKDKIKFNEMTFMHEYAISHEFLSSIIHQLWINIEVELQLLTTTSHSSNLNQTTNSKLTFKINSSPSFMVIFSYSSSYPSGTLLNGTLHSSIDLFTSHSPLPINIKPKPIITTNQTHHCHPNKTLEFGGSWKWRTLTLGNIIKWARHQGEAICL